MKIVKNIKLLKKPIPAKELTADEIKNITKTLTTELKRHNALGLAANQLGIDIRACIINAISSLVLINPRITERSRETIAYSEQCLSDDKSMKRPVKTIRHKKITIECDNLGVIEFGPSESNWESAEDFFGDKGLLECVCAQHEIDHLDGILMRHPSRRYSTTVTAPKRYGRNERIMIKLPNGETEFMKYKKAIPLLKIGCELL